MVTKLRNFGAWIWYNKERMFLAALVVILVYRVYQAALPPEDDAGAVFARPPISQAPEAWPEELVPRPPAAAPARNVPASWRALHARNPFSYFSEGAAAQDGQVTAESLGISLRDIQVLPTGVVRARIRTISTDKWYTEGEQFEQFELLEIDTATRRAVVYSQQFSQRLVLESQR